MRPIVCFPLGIFLIAAAVGLFVFSNHLADRQGAYVISFYVGVLVLLIAGLLTLANRFHKIVPDDWPYT
ncbi:MAG: hypothetical protein DLM50_00150 [Candidatus Meridianibacter frigidus]|nr:MAG: hypothetical protein DLM50_00150 [Candidatus Eremiobacteraeota bacterium]